MSKSYFIELHSCGYILLICLSGKYGLVHFVKISRGVCHLLGRSDFLAGIPPSPGCWCLPPPSPCPITLHLVPLRLLPDGLPLAVGCPPSSSRSLLCSISWEVNPSLKGLCLLPLRSAGSVGSHLGAERTPSPKYLPRPELPNTHEG